MLWCWIKMQRDECPGPARACLMYGTHPRSSRSLHKKHNPAPIGPGTRKTVEAAGEYYAEDRTGKAGGGLGASGRGSEKVRPRREGARPDTSHTLTPRLFCFVSDQ